MLDTIALEVLEQYLNVRAWYHLSKSEIPYLVNKYRNLFPHNGLTTFSHRDSYNWALIVNGNIVLLRLKEKFDVSNYNKLHNFISCSLGDFFGLGLTDQGKILTWGKNNDGQCDVPSYHQGSFIACSTGSYHSLALTNKGWIIAWGCNRFNQCDVPLEFQGQFIACSAGSLHSLGLTRDGNIISWGIKKQSVPNKYNGSFIACNTSRNGLYSAFGLSNRGEIIIWERYYSELKAPSEYQGSFISCALGMNHALGLTKDGSIISWGKNNYGQCDVPSEYQGSFIKCYANEYQSFGLTRDGCLINWGKKSAHITNVIEKYQGQFM